MNPIDIKRRTICKAAAASIVVGVTGGITRPVYAFIDPATGAIIAASIGAAISAVVQWFSNEKTAEINQKIAAAGFKHDWATRMLGQTPVSIGIARNAYKNEALTLGLASNIDDIGTGFAIKDGLVYVSRGRYSDTMNAKEALLADPIFSDYGNMPVPLEPMANNNLTKAESSRIRDKLSQSMDIDTIALVSSRRYSLEQSPKQSQANVEMVAFLDKSLPPIEGKPQVRYTYTV